MGESPIYQRVTFWVREYGGGDLSDKVGVETFMECETDELVVSLRNELAGIAAGNFKEESLDQIVGAKRRLRHGSYVEWAKLMLLWMSGGRR